MRTCDRFHAGYIRFIPHLQPMRRKRKIRFLFIDPGFPVQKQQLVVMGQKFETFDVYDYRGDKLKEKLESYLKKGNISAIIIRIPITPAGFA